MTLSKQGNFTFNHVDQQDDLYKVKSALEIKTAFDSRGNELKTSLNALIDSLAAIASGNSGADNIGATAIQDLTGTTIQSIIKSLRDTLKSVTNGTSGADFINSAPITGVTGSTLYAQLSSLKGLIDAVYTKTELQSTISGNSGAKKIGATPIATSPSDVQGILEWLKNQMDSTVLGQIPDGAVTSQKLSSDVSTQMIPFGSTAGSANVYTVTLNPSISSYTDGLAVSLKINVDSTAASTLNVNSLGAKSLKKANGADVTNLKANGVYTFRYNSTTGNFILQGEGGSGTATAGDILSGKTASTDTGDVTGSMTNNGAVTITPNASSQPIPSGYHNGSGSVPGVVVPAANVLTGTTIAGTSGTMPNRGAMTITPGTTNQTIPSGFHNGSGIVNGDTNLIAANILSGVNIFGVAGNAKRTASGTISTPNSSTVTISGLAFTPNKFEAYVTATTTDPYTATGEVIKMNSPSHSGGDVVFNFSPKAGSASTITFGANSITLSLSTTATSYGGAAPMTVTWSNIQVDWVATE